MNIKSIQKIGDSNIGEVTYEADDQIKIEVENENKISNSKINAPFFIRDND